MTKLNKIREHSLSKQLLLDSEKYLDYDDSILLEIELPKSVELDELQYYIHQVGFSIYYMIVWFKQLNLSIENLSNHNYSKKHNFTRADFLIYDIENYIIRYQSSLDRIINLISNIFHLTNSSEYNTLNIVTSNLKVDRTKIPEKLKPIKRYIRSVCSERNKIVHHHSILEKELKKIELYYTNDFSGLNYDEESINDLKLLRKEKLKEYIKNKKTLFNKQNERLFELILPLLDELHINYIKQSQRLKKQLNYN